MKTLICARPGKFEYVTGVAPVETLGQAIIKIKRIGVCGTDIHAFEGTQPFFDYPRVLGHELSGELVFTGEAEGFKAGDSVTFIPYFNCGQCIACNAGLPNACVRLKVCGVHQDGGMAEYLSVPAGTLVHGPGLSHDALALVEPLAIGAHGVRRAAIRPGEFVLVIGAGPIGLGTMEFASISGGQVIALDVNQDRLNFCRERLKIEHTINAAAEDATARLEEITKGNMPTVVIDATGNLKAINNAFKFMAHGGRYVLIGLQKADISFSHPEFHKREGTLMSSRNATRQDFDHVISCMQKGELDPTTYITHRVAFDEVKEQFSSWLDPANRVIKAMIEII